jgi:hypothetical protein
MLVQGVDCHDVWHSSPVGCLGGVVCDVTPIGSLWKLAMHTFVTGLVMEVKWSVGPKLCQVAVLQACCGLVPSSRDVDGAVRMFSHFQAERYCTMSFH